MELITVDVFAIFARSFASCWEAEVSELVTRPDDVPETVRSRLAVYHKETEALKGFYEKLGKLRLIEGNQPIEDATRDILAALGVSK